ncbi:unnamed protein product [Lactuca virosa]|uniref:Protein transport protein Sec61 subunit beta n=1 Tax=Lactuca virosa TaxID=75947 RepID=A0AAU9LNQ1_9ASTR|nr:unnamed protein product [Lactuca virosa]
MAKTTNHTWQTLIGLIDVAATIPNAKKFNATKGERYRNLLIYLLKRMALNGGAPPRGSAAAAAANLRRRRTGGATGSSAPGGTAGNMLQFYTDDAPGLKISPNVVLVMSIGFIAFVAVLHVMAANSWSMQDSALGEDVGGDTIARRLRRKCNIEPFLDESPFVIEIADGDELSGAEAVRQGKTIDAGGCPTSPSASNDIPSKVGHSFSGAPGVVLVVDRIVESSEFALGIHHMKAAWVAAGVVKGKQAALALSSGSGSGPSEPDAGVGIVPWTSTLSRVTYYLPFVVA